MGNVSSIHFGHMVVKDEWTMGRDFRDWGRLLGRLNLRRIRSCSFIDASRKIKTKLNNVCLYDFFCRANIYPLIGITNHSRINLNFPQSEGPVI